MAEGRRVRRWVAEIMAQHGLSAEEAWEIARRDLEETIAEHEVEAAVRALLAADRLVPEIASGIVAEIRKADRSETSSREVEVNRAINLVGTGEAVDREMDAAAMPEPGDGSGVEPAPRPRRVTSWRSVPFAIFT